MSRELHQGKHSLIGIIRNHLEGWRKENQWSRETMAGEIFKSHESINGPINSGIELEDKQDVFETMKINAQRIYRWLDDVTKDINLMPLNFLPTILATMPERVRLETVNEILAPLGMGSYFLKSEPERQSFSVSIMQRMIVEDAQAHSAYGDLLDGASRAELLHAQSELQEAIAEKQKALEQVQQHLAV